MNQIITFCSITAPDNIILTIKLTEQNLATINKHMSQIITFGSVTVSNCIIITVKQNRIDEFSKYLETITEFNRIEKIPQDTIFIYLLSGYDQNQKYRSLSSKQYCKKISELQYLFLLYPKRTYMLKMALEKYREQLYHTCNFGRSVLFGGVTLLHIVCQLSTKFEKEIVTLVINCYDNVDITDDNGDTALVYASRVLGKYSTLETMEMLLEKGANPNINNNVMHTALINAVCNFPKHKYDVIKTVELLLKYGANVNAKDINGNSVLNLAILRFSSFVAANKLEIIEVLLRAGANVNDCSSYYKTALITFLIYLRNMINKKEEDVIKVIKLLLDYGVDIKMCDANGLTAIDYVKRNICELSGSVMAKITIMILEHIMQIDANRIGQLENKLQICKQKFQLISDVFSN